MARRGIPEVNAGSMADIAFLLLIFFLVTTTIETNSGIPRTLPPIQDENVDPPVIRQRNIFTVVVNRNDQLLVEDELMEIKDLRQAAIDFLDNGGGVNEAGESCDYCRGNRDTNSSDHPEKAIISLQNDRETSYDTYLIVQNELTAAYNELRNRVHKPLFVGKTYVEEQAMYDAGSTPSDVKDKLKEKLEVTRKMYPQKLSEAEPRSN